MKIKLPEKILKERIFDIRAEKDSGKIEVEDNFIKEMFFMYSKTHLIINVRLKEKNNLDLLEMKINKGLLYLHSNSRVGILNIDNKHYLLPETFWDDYLSLAIPLKTLNIYKCDLISMSFKFLSKDKKVIFESDNIKFQIKLKGELCTKM